MEALRVRASSTKRRDIIWTPSAVGAGNGIFETSRLVIVAVLAISAVPRVLRSTIATSPRTHGEV